MAQRQRSRLQPGSSFRAALNCSQAFSVCSDRDNTHTHSVFQRLIFIHIGWDIPLCPHGWPALAPGHRTVDPRSSLHGDEQDLGRYPAYWKHTLLLTFRNGEGGRALSAGRGGVGGWRRALAPCWCCQVLYTVAQVS